MSINEIVISRLMDRIGKLERMVAGLQKRANNMIREGKVLEVDYEKGLAIVDAHGIPSKPVPWLQQAGDIVDWDPPSVGQRMMMFSPNGDLGRSFLLPGGYTQDKPQPYQEGNVYGRKVGDTKVFATADGYNVETGTFTIKGDLVIQGGIVTHNGKNIGDTHIHGGVKSGGELTDVPAN